MAFLSVSCVAAFYSGIKSRCVQSTSFDFVRFVRMTVEGEEASPVPVRTGLVAVVSRDVLAPQRALKRGSPASRSRTAGSCVDFVRLKCRSTPPPRSPQTPPLPPAFPAPHFPSSRASLPVSPSRNLRFGMFFSPNPLDCIHISMWTRRKKNKKVEI